MSIQDVQQAYNRFKGLLTEYQELMKPEPAHEVAAAPAVPAPVDEAVPLHLSAAVAEVAAPTVAPVAEAAAVEAAVAAATAADEAEEAGLEAAAAAPPVEGGDLEEELLDAGEVVAADPAAVAAAAAPA
ncbi:MAG: hypothetical protein HY939_06000, partial [Gammaproteobacteria bacterium]|nr:hypothetical protein [Gammaproteobacteria bacterium]